MMQSLHTRSLCAALLAAACGAQAAPVDTLRFGDPASERQHHLVQDHSERIQGAAGQAARRLLPLGTNDWRGGSVSFDLAPDPKAQNYLTLTLWGGEENHDRLVLSCDGWQVGTRHLGDTDPLDIGSVAPMYAGRFFHNTSPLPLRLTQGKRRLACRIDSTGTIWPYGQSFAQFQKPMTDPARGMYALTVHTDPFLPAGALEAKGSAPAAAVRPAPGPEVLDALERRVGHALDGLLATGRPLHQSEMLFLARAYDVDWTGAYRNPKVAPMLVRGLDAYYHAFRENPELVRMDRSTYNPGWFGLGQAAWALLLRQGAIEPLLDQPLGGPQDGAITRRAAYAAMFVSIRDWQRVHRRFYTNQSMINDTFGIYLANRALALLDPARALPEKDALRYLYESAGIEPWRGDDLPGGGHRFMAGGPDGTYKGAYRVAPGYRQVTDKGLTRELGYVGNYGEVLDWVAAMYDATRPAPGRPGDARILAQLVKLTKARANFRYPLPDADGYRAMALESVVGWRDVKYPGDVVYGQRTTWDASAIEVAAITRDPAIVGYAQQMFDDNQFFASLAERMKTDSLRVNAGLLRVPADYAALARLARNGQRLPMSAGQPDFVFSDEQDGVVAVKTGDEVFYAALYWRALKAVNGLARVHYMTPMLDRIAVVHEDVRFEPSGHTWTRPEESLGGSDPRFPKFRYPNAAPNASAGEQLPIAKFPEGVAATYGEDSPYAGKAGFYTLRYGPFVVAMNTTTGKSFTLTAPTQGALRELVSGRAVAHGERLVLAPRTTVVLYALARQH